VNADLAESALNGTGEAETEIGDDVAVKAMAK